MGRVLEISLLWLLLRETVIMLLETYPLLFAIMKTTIRNRSTITGPYYVRKSAIKRNKSLLWLRKYYAADYRSEI